MLYKYSTYFTTVVSLHAVANTCSLRVLFSIALAILSLFSLPVLLLKRGPSFSDALITSPLPVAVVERHGEDVVDNLGLLLGAHVGRNFGFQNLIKCISVV